MAKPPKITTSTETAKIAAAAPKIEKAVRIAAEESVRLGCLDRGDNFLDSDMVWELSFRNGKFFAVRHCGVTPEEIVVPVTIAVSVTVGEPTRKKASY